MVVICVYKSEDDLCCVYCGTQGYKGNLRTCLHPRNPNAHELPKCEIVQPDYAYDDVYCKHCKLDFGNKSGCLGMSNPGNFPSMRLARFCCQPSPAPVRTDASSVTTTDVKVLATAILSAFYPLLRSTLSKERLVTKICAALTDGGVRSPVRAMVRDAIAEHEDWSRTKMADLWK